MSDFNHNMCVFFFFNIFNSIDGGCFESIANEAVGGRVKTVQLQKVKSVPGLSGRPADR